MRSEVLTPCLNFPRLRRSAPASPTGDWPADRRRRGAAPARDPPPRARRGALRRRRCAAARSPMPGAAVNICGCPSTTATRCSRTWACPDSSGCVGAERRRRDAPAGPVRVRRRRPAAALHRPADVRRPVAVAGRRRAARRDRAHRPRPDRSGFDDGAFVAALRAQAHRGQARAARPVTDLRRRQHLRRRGAVAGQAARRPADRRADHARRSQRLLGHVRDVLGEALAAGGTSFDALYVNVNGESGYFDRSLNAYGREGEPCARCGTPIRRESFMNRSSFSCPNCQPRPGSSGGPAATSRGCKRDPRRVRRCESCS